MKNIRTAVVFWIVVGISMLGFAGCEAVTASVERDVIVACIKSGGTWIAGDYTHDAKTRTNEKSIRLGDRCEPAS